MEKKRKFTQTFKQQVIKELQQGVSKKQIIQKYEIAPSMLTKWNKQYGNSNCQAQKMIYTLQKKVEGTLIIKEQGLITSRFPRIKHIHSAPYLTDQEKCFKNLISKPTTEKWHQSDIKETEGIIKKIFRKDLDIASLYHQLQHLQTKKQLNNLYQFIIENCNHQQDKEILTKNPSLTLSIVIKKIVILYFCQKLLALPLKRTEELEREIINGTSPETLLYMIEGQTSPIAQQNGINDLSKKVVIDTINVIHDSKQPHLCWNHCQNGYPHKCSKIKDREKKDIIQYPFIQDGYQIKDKEGKVLQFVITKCQNYQQ